MNDRIQYSKANLIMLAFYDFVVEKTNWRKTTAFDSRFSLPLIPPWLHAY